jgi:hypothetical protein
VKIGEQILKLLVAERIADRGHHVSSSEDDGGDTLVIRGRAAGQIFLLIESLETRAMQRVIAVRIVAAGTM